MRVFRIMIVEDDAKARDELGKLLLRHGYAITPCPLAVREIPAAVESEKPQLVLLDINLPGEDGFWVCREIRRRSPVPIIFLTARDTDLDQVMAMTLGGDDYLSKPYSSDVLLARIAALIRRCYGQRPEAELLRHQDLTVDLATALAIRGERQVELTKNELRILHTLLLHPGRVVTRDQLMERLWQTDSFVDDNTLTVNVRRLRQKLADLGLPELVATRRGLGYLIE